MLNSFVAAAQGYWVIAAILAIIVLVELLLRYRRHRADMHLWKTGKLVKVLDRILNPPERQYHSYFF